MAMARPDYQERLIRENNELEELWKDDPLLLRQKVRKAQPRLERRSYSANQLYEWYARGMELPTDS